MKAYQSRVSLWVGVGLTLGAPAAYAAFPDCPTAPGQAGLEAWRDEAYAQMSSYGSPQVRDAIDRCFPRGVPSCLKRIYDASQPRASGSYGDAFPPEEKALPQVFADGNDGKFVIPPNIEAIIAGQARAPRTRERVDYTRWKVAKYKSRSTGGFDLGEVGPGRASTESLMLIYVPGDSFDPPIEFDRWINIGLPSDQGADRFNPMPQQEIPEARRYRRESNLPVTLTMLTVRKPAPNRRARILFQNFRRPDSETPHYTGSPSSPGSCQSCHPNGMRAISPLGYFAPGTPVPTITEGTRWMAVNGARVGDPVPTLPAQTQQVVTDMNNIMSSYTMSGPMDWGTVTENGREATFANPHAQGAYIGAMQPARPRDDAFMDACMTRERSISYSSIRDVDSNFSMGSTLPNRDRVRSAMNCAMCHGTMRGGLNDILSSKEMVFKLLVDRSMPPGRMDLTEADRIALINCLNAEKDENKRAWFTSGNACTSGFAGSSSFGEAGCVTDNSSAASSADPIPASARTSMPGHVVGRQPAAGCIQPSSVFEGRDGRPSAPGSSHPPGAGSNASGEGHASKKNAAKANRLPASAPASKPAH